MSEPEKPSSLDDLNRRLGDARRRRTGGSKSRTRDTSVSDYGPAVRIGVDLVAGIAVGVFIGWLLDRWLGTSPWMLIAFFILGAAAGMTNVIRAAQRLETEAQAAREKASGQDRED